MESNDDYKVLCIFCGINRVNSRWKICTQEAHSRNIELIPDFPSLQIHVFVSRRHPPRFYGKSISLNKEDMEHQDLWDY